ncbi:TRAP transporter substrate-binding protein [Ornithinimicrobium faecis]|uniref:TRAP transporter substrate-binding protein n=1 Tax=Ornithinimicrobium faecis TaxID=2934158 RepID=A0ABY4YS34_9MICO|nr:TRAP transporter substrate-binding protein [Ornithinimicrobium sp. HY1793]USQ79173.1 TRAP transporter substrate-binding protein [Ornithinimicrobium sp. HY1793]
MKNKIALVSALAAGTLVMTACSGDGEDGGAAGEEIHWRLGHSYGPESLENRSAERLADNLEKASDGKITVEIFPSSQLGSWEEMQEQMEVGSVDIVIESIGSVERYTDLAGIEGVPFLYEDADHYFETWDSDLGDEIMQAIKEDSGFLLTGAIYRGPRILNSTMPINNLADAEGLKIRVPNQETYIQTWQALGTAPTPLSFNEVFSGLEQGAIEAQENPVNVARFNSFYEVAPYIANTNHLYGSNHFQLWGETYDGWDEETRAMYDEAVDEVSTWSREVALEELDDNVAFLEENGVTFADVDRTEWVEATLDIVDSADPKVQEWVAQIREG